MADSGRDNKRGNVEFAMLSLFGRPYYFIPVMCFFGMVLGLFSPLFGSPSPSDFVKTMLIVTTGMFALVITMIQYLQGSRLSVEKYTEVERYKEQRELRNLKTEFQTILSNPAFLHAKELTSDERESILVDLRSTVQHNLKEELALEFEARYAATVIEQAHLKSIRTMFDSTRERLLEEITSLGRRGNLNLVLGSMTSLFGLSALGYIVFSNSEVSSSAFMVNHIPRITLILFIQLFSFFFLKLYRSSLESIKYFQNELTNVELRFIAINASVMSGNAKSLASIVSTFSKTERNFLLQKGQTTVEIEKTRLDNEKNDDIVAILSDVIKKTATKTN